MAKTIKSTNGGKLGAGYKATLWVIGVVLFLAFAFATFCAFGGLDVISPITPNSGNEYTVQVDENGNYYYVDANGNIVSNADLPNLNTIVSNADLSGTDAAVAE